MSWNSGVYTRGYASWSVDAASNLPISATKFDTEDNDFATGLNNCLTKDGTSGPNAAMTWGLAGGQVLALTRGSDGVVFSIARTAGSSNPSLAFGVTDVGAISNILTNGAVRITINSAGNFALNAPGSGTHSISGLDNNYILQLKAPGINGGVLGFFDTGAALIRGYIGFGASTLSGVAITDFSIAPGTGGSVVIGTPGGAAVGTRFGPNGNVTINAPSSSPALTITGPLGDRALTLNASVSVGNSFGLNMNAGTNSADQALLLRNAANTASYFLVRGDGAIQGGGAVAGALVDMTPDKSSFTGTLTGCTTSPTATFNWTKMGNMITIDCATGLVGTSNSTACSILGLPAALAPARAIGCPASISNASAAEVGVITLGGTTITLNRQGGAAFSASAVKGLQGNFSMTYAVA